MRIDVIIINIIMTIDPRDRDPNNPRYLLVMKRAPERITMIIIDIMITVIIITEVWIHKTLDPKDPRYLLVMN